MTQVLFKFKVVFGLLGILACWLGGAVSVQAAAFNDAASGNWNVGTTWGGACASSCAAGTDYPGINDTATIDSHAVTITQNEAALGVTISGGTLNGGSSTLSINTSGWTFSSGTFNPQTGTVKLAQGMTIAGNTTFNNLTIDPNTIADRTITLTGYTASTTGTLTVNNSTSGGSISLIGGTIAAQGDIVWDSLDVSANVNNVTTALLINGTGTQTLTASGATNTVGNFITLTVDKASGTLVLFGTIRTSKSWTLTQGTIDATTNDSTVIFTTTQVITGSQTLDNVRFDSVTGVTTRTLTVASGSTLTIAGTFTIDNTSTSPLNLVGNYVIQGDLVVDSANVSSSITANFVLSGSASQALTLTGGSTTTGQFASTTINKSGGTLTVTGVLRTAKNFTVSAGTVDWTTNDATISFASTMTFNPAAGNTYDNVYIDTAGAVTLSTGFSLAGNWTNAGSFTSGANTVTFTGTGTSTVVTGGTGITQDFQNFTINKSGGGIVQLSTNGLDVDGTLTVTAGTLDLNGQSVMTTTSCSVTGSLKLAGFEALSCTPTLNTNSTVEYVATTSISRAIKDWTYHHLTISASSGTFTDSGTRTVGGNLAINSGTFTASNGTTNVAGNFTNAGTFTHNSGTLVLNGTNQTLSGATTFYNLTKTDGTNDETDRILTFPAGATTTIVGLFTITGTDATDRVNLVSSTPGSYWGLALTGTKSITWADVTDSNASGGARVAPTNTVDGGHNLNWFNSTPTVTLTSPVSGATTTNSTPTFSFTTADGDGDTVSYSLTVDDTSTFASPVYAATSSYLSAGSVATTTSVLADGAYYWRVLVGDGLATSSYSVANSGAVAFVVDTTAPTPSSVSAGTPGEATATITWTTIEGASSQVEYGLTVSYGSFSSLDATRVTSHSVNLSSLTPGTTYHYRVASVDEAGNAATSSDATFATTDITVPSVTLTAPTTGSTVSGTVAITATASDNGTLVGVQFKRDDTILLGSEDVSSPFGVSWDSTQTSNGSHTLLAVARDGAGNYATSTITVTVDNGTAVPEPEPEPEAGSISSGSTAAARAARAAAAKPASNWWNPLSWVAPQPAKPSVPATPTESLPNAPIAVSPLTLPDLPTPLSRLVTTLPSLSNLFSSLNISTLSDLPKLANQSITLPTLTETATPPAEIYFGQVASLDLPVTLAVKADGSTTQSLSLPPNTAVTLTVRPEDPAKTVVGYLVLDNQLATAEQRSHFAHVANPNLAALAALPEAKPTEDRLVLDRFAYEDDNQDGLYEATLTTPPIPGTYEVITVITYERVDLGTKELRLQTVVDPEGYVYAAVGATELRIPSATVRLWWQNPETAKFELWPAAQYHQKNPQITDKRGTYSFLVPFGDYYLTAEAAGYRSYQGEVFNVALGQGVHQNIALKPSWWQKIKSVFQTIFS